MLDLGQVPGSFSHNSLQKRWLCSMILRPANVCWPSISSRLYMCFCKCFYLTAQHNTSRTIFICDCLQTTRCFTPLNVRVSNLAFDTSMFHMRRLCMSQSASSFICTWCCTNLCWCWVPSCGACSVCFLAGSDTLTNSESTSIDLSST